MMRFLALLSVFCCWWMPAQAASVSDLAVEAPKNSSGLTLSLQWKNGSDGPDALALQVQRKGGEETDWTPTGEPLGLDAEGMEDSVPSTGTWAYRIVGLDADGESLGPLGPEASGVTQATWLNTNPGHLLLLGLIALVGTLMMVYTKRAQRGEEIYIRRIPGIDAIEEGIGRCVLLVWLC